jgi:hypothetical protein
VFGTVRCMVFFVMELKSGHGRLARFFPCPCARRQGYTGCSVPPCSGDGIGTLVRRVSRRELKLVVCPEQHRRQSSGELELGLVIEVEFAVR